MRKGTVFFTSESVTEGHPDKICDQISDAVLDAALRMDPNARVACESFVTTDFVLVGGEMTVPRFLDVEGIARKVVKEIGYNDMRMGFDYNTFRFQNLLHEQSPDISQGVTEGQGEHKEQGAGDQGMMFGYACRETPELMPLPISLAHKITQRMAEARKSGLVPFLRPDGKAQVTVEYREGRPVRVDSVVVAAQHTEGTDKHTIEMEIIEKVIKPVIPAQFLDKDVKYHINKTGKFVIGGPHGDSGLTGRKIIVDTYGGMGAHGGGAFSGKDPTKVDRSASYMTRHIAKNIVAAGLAERCQIQIAYVIGMAEPVSVMVDTFGTGKVPDDRLTDIVRKVFPLTPKGIIEYLQLRRPIYRKTAAYGHFGRNDPDFSWEKTGKVEELRKEAGLLAAH